MRGLGKNRLSLITECVQPGARQVRGIQVSGSDSKPYGNPEPETNSPSTPLQPTRLTSYISALPTVPAPPPKKRTGLQLGSEQSSLPHRVFLAEGLLKQRELKGDAKRIEVVCRIDLSRVGALPHWTKLMTHTFSHQTLGRDVPVQ